DAARCLRRAGRKARSAQPRVDELVDAEVQQGESGAEEGDAKARRRPPPPPPAANRVVRESLAQHLPPVPESWRRGGGRTAEAEERDRHVGVDGVERGEQKRRSDDRDEVGKQLHDDDPY